MKSFHTDLYQKQGKKYVKVPWPSDWTGFPCDGVWLVRSMPGGTSSSCILQLGDIPELYPFARMMIQRDELANEINKIYDRHPNGISACETATEIMRFLHIKDRQAHATDSTTEEQRQIEVEE